jgi:hypothetical protein
MKEKKAFKFITWGFIWKSYLPFIGLELDWMLSPPLGSGKGSLHEWEILVHLETKCFRRFL